VEQETIEGCLQKRISVERIPDNGVSQVVEMDAELMAATGGGMGLHQAVWRVCIQEIVTGLTGFSLTQVHAHAARAIGTDRRIDQTGRGHWVTMYQRHIALIYLPAFELSIEMAMRPGMLCKEQDTADVLVQTVDHPQRLPQLSLNLGEKISRLSMSFRDTGQAHGFINRYNGVVFIEDGNRQRVSFHCFFRT